MLKREQREILEILINRVLKFLNSIIRINRFDLLNYIDKKKDEKYKQLRLKKIISLVLLFTVIIFFLGFDIQLYVIPLILIIIFFSYLIYLAFQTSNYLNYSILEFKKQKRFLNYYYKRLKLGIDNFTDTEIHSTADYSEDLINLYNRITEYCEFFDSDKSEGVLKKSLKFFNNRPFYWFLPLIIPSLISLVFSYIFLETSLFLLIIINITFILSIFLIIIYLLPYLIHIKIKESRRNYELYLYKSQLSDYFNGIKEFIRYKKIPYEYFKGKERLFSIRELGNLTIEYLCEFDNKRNTIELIPENISNLRRCRHCNRINSLNEKLLRISSLELMVQEFEKSF